MGAANVIPGVSGGSIAFITGIYERLINALKNLNLKALKLLLARDFGGFARHIDLFFLMTLGVGVVAGLVGLSKILGFMFEKNAVLVWAFFFGLILASIYFVGKTVGRWGLGAVFALVVGVAVAAGVAFLTPASENASPLYLVLCGVIAMASMIIPGISGSFVLLLLGNYKLIMIDSVGKLPTIEWHIFIPVGIGAVIGLLTLAHVLAWIFKKYHDLAVSLMTGFVAGSLVVIWPWKTEIQESFTLADGTEKVKTVAYDWHFPAANGETLLAVGVMVAGILLVWLIEVMARKFESAKSV